MKGTINEKLQHSSAEIKVLQL